MRRDKIDEAKSRGWEKKKRKTKVKDLKKTREEKREREHRDGNGHRPQRVCHYQTQTSAKFKLLNPPATRSGF